MNSSSKIVLSSFILLLVLSVSAIVIVIFSPSQPSFVQQPFSVINGNVYHDYNQCVIRVDSNHCKTSDGTWWSIYTKSDTNKSEPTEIRSVKHIYYANISTAFKMIVKVLNIQLNDESGITYNSFDESWTQHGGSVFTVYNNPNNIKDNLATKYYNLLSAMPQPMVTLYFSHSCTQVTISKGLWGTFVTSNNETYNWPNVSHTYTINCHTHFSYWTPAGQK